MKSHNDQVINSVKSDASLNPSMICDLPIVTQFEAHIGRSIVAANAQSVVAPASPGSAEKTERDKPTHSSRRRRKTPNRSVQLEPGEQTVFEPGARLVDRYEVIRKIGQGGMSLVYEAFDEVRNEHVAIKVLLPSLSGSRRMQERFLQEGRIASNFSHKHIARVFDLHQTESLFMLTMELLHGSTLRHDMERRKTQRQAYRPTEVLATIQQVSQALEVVHAANVIHRDLKPENLWMSLDESVKIMDFGIARDASRAAHTTGSRGSGTPYYIAPEQLSANGNLDHRADQYSLGVIAYEMLTGNIPQGVVLPPHEVNSEIPRTLSMAIYRAINSDQAKRFSSVNEFAEAAKFAVGRPWWVKVAKVAGVIGLIGGSALGIQFGLMPMWESKPSVVWENFTDQTAKENEAFEIVLRDSKSTLTSQELTFKLSNAPTGAKIDPATGKFGWTPDESQGPKDYSIDVLAIIEPQGQPPVVEERSLKISVVEQFNSPVMDTPETLVAKEHDLFKVQLEARDVNIPAVGLRFELLEGPAGMSVSRSGLLQWKPQENDGGSNAAPIVKVSLDSDEHLDAAVTRKLSMRVDESIDAPNFTSASRFKAEVGEATTFRLTARDPNTPEINRYFQLKNGDQLGMTVDPQSGEIFWTPTEAQAGKELELVAVIGWDGAGRTQILAEQIIKVSVAELRVEKETEATSDRSTASEPQTVKPVISTEQPAVPNSAPTCANTTPVSNPPLPQTNPNPFPSQNPTPGQTSNPSPTCPNSPSGNGGAPFTCGTQLNQNNGHANPGNQTNQGQSNQTNQGQSNQTNQGQGNQTNQGQGNQGKGQCGTVRQPNRNNTTSTGGKPNLSPAARPFVPSLATPLKSLNKPQGPSGNSNGKLHNQINQFKKPGFRN
jgi:serine/threonine protein kinase